MCEAPGRFCVFCFYFVLQSFGFTLLNIWEYFIGCHTLRMKKHWVNLRIWMLFSSREALHLFLAGEKGGQRKSTLIQLSWQKLSVSLASAGISSLPSLPRHNLAGLQTESLRYLVLAGPLFLGRQFLSPQIWETAESSVHPVSLFAATYKLANTWRRRWHLISGSLLCTSLLARILASLSLTPAAFSRQIFHYLHSHTQYAYICFASIHSGRISMV